MRVLFVNHVGLVSGAERSLVELLRGMPAEWQADLACPAGPLQSMAEEAGATAHIVPAAEGSFRLHPHHTPTMLVSLWQLGRSIRKLVASAPYDVVHANSARAALALLLAFGPRRTRGDAPATVVHVRDLLPESALGRMVGRLTIASADQVIAISQAVGTRIPSASVCVIHNPVDTSRFIPRDGEASPASTLAIIGQITPWKGQDTAVRVLAGIRASGIDARLLVVGEAKFVGHQARFDNQAYARSLERLVSELGVDDHVEFLGERENVAAIMAAADLVLVPSWEEPFGRTIVEAMACGRPVVATDRGGPREIITDGVDGRLVSPTDLDAWIEAVLELATDSRRRLEMGRAGRATAVNRFDVSGHVEAVLAAYAASRSRAAARR